MEFINKDFPRPDVTVQVVAERCDGCAFCVDVCPVAALKVADHECLNGRRMVVADKDLCKGCGVCQATCPKEAIVIPGLSPQELRDCIRAALEPA